MRSFTLERLHNDGRAVDSAFIKTRSRAPAAGAALGVASLVLGSPLAHAQQGPAAPSGRHGRRAGGEEEGCGQGGADPCARRGAGRSAIDPNDRRRRRLVSRRPSPAPTQTAAAADAGTGAGQGGASGSAYNPRDSQITRLPTKIVDTPQSITIIPQQVIQDQHTSTLVEALHNVPGISFLGGEGGTQGDNINIHGYSARNDIYRDGIRDPGWYTRDTFAVENVEVLKGPSSFAFGRGSTGGVINETTKLPKFTDFTIVEDAGYTSPGGRGTIDVNRAFGDVAARIVAVGNDTDVADRPHVDTKRVGVAPSLTVNIAPDTRATVSYIYQHDDNVPDYGIPLIPGSYFGSKFNQPAPVSKDTFYGTAYDRERVDANIVTLKIEHDINTQWRLSNETRFSDVDRFVSVRGTQISTGVPTNLYAAPAGGTALKTLAPGTNLDAIYIANANYFQNHTANTLATNLSDLTGHFYTWGFEHTFDVGVELDRETRDQFRSTYTGTFDRVNLGDPSAYPLALGVLPTNSTDQYDVGKGAGVYASDQIKINRYFELMGGVRYDYLSVTQTSATENTLSHSIVGPYSATVPYNVVNTVNFVSWRVGAVFHPVENASFYYMYGTSFDPSSEYLTIAGGAQSQPPTTNETQELGAKYDLFNHQLSLTGRALSRRAEQRARIRQLRAWHLPRGR